VYYAKVDNFIDSTVTFIDFSTGTPGPGGVVFNGTTRSRNVDAELYGLEAEVEYDAGLWYTSAGLTIPRGQETSSGDPLGSIPQDRLTWTLGYRPHHDWDVGARLTLAADQDDVPTGSPPGDGYTVVDLFATYRPTLDTLNGATIQFGVDNVFDEVYQIYPNGLNQGGRTIKIAASFQF